MSNTADTLREIKNQLRQAMNGTASAAMRQNGLKYKLNFGVEYPRLKQIAATHEKDHDLAQALWREDIRECKILAGMLQPVDRFDEDYMDLWLDTMPNVEIAQYTAMHLFQYLEYAPRKCMALLACESELRQITAYYTIARLLQQRPDMTDRAQNEFLDQAVSGFISGSPQMQRAIATALRSFMRGSEQHSFAVCRQAEAYKDSPNEGAQRFYAWVDNEVSANFG